MATAITRQLNYSLKPTAPKGERVKRMIPSLANNTANGYAMSDTIIFYIPAGTARQVWDGQTAYLNFSLQWQWVATGGQAVNTASLSVDYSAASVIRRLDLYSSEGQLLESIERYGELFNILFDCQQTQAESLGLSPMLGTSGEITNANLRRGQQFGNPVFAAAGNSATQTQEFSIPLLSGMFQLCETYFPAYALSGDIRIEIILDTQVNSVVVTPAGNVTGIGNTLRVVNPNIHLDYVTLEPSVISQMESVYAGRDLVIHSSSYHTYENTITAAAAGSMNWIIPARIMSVKALFTMWRRTAVTGVQGGFTKTSRTTHLLA